MNDHAGPAYGRIREADEGLVRGWQLVRRRDGRIVEIYSAARWLPDPPEVRELERRALDRLFPLPKEIR
jgi:hypothetical protein